MDYYSPWSEREIWPILGVTISPKPEGPHSPKLVYVHYTSIPTCMNFLSQFRLIKFFDTHGLYSPWSEREIWPILEVAISPKPKSPHSPKLVYVQYTSRLTCMNFLSQFRLIKFFDSHGLYIVHGQKGKFGQIWKYQYLRNWKAHTHQNWCTCI